MGIYAIHFGRWRLRDEHESCNACRVMLNGKKILVPGAYGLIGSELVRRLAADGAIVTGLVRSSRTARRIIPDILTIEADMAALTDVARWRAIVSGQDAVVNAAGALQSGLKDNLSRLQDQSIRALIAACEETGVKTFVQISAPGAIADASTAFLRTKARGDEGLRRSKLNWVIFKPGLVIGRNAYGGTSLLRMLASFPIVQPLVYGSAKIQCVGIDDVADAVGAALSGNITMRRDYDLVEDETHTLGEMVAQFRVMLGSPPALAQINLPRWCGGLVARIADAAGWLGWRSPLRTTALRVMSEDVLGNPQAWRIETGARLKNLDEILAGLPATAQERIFGRVQLLYPVMIMALSIFFVASGFIALANLDAAKAVLAGRVSENLARIMAAGGAGLDIFLGLAILFRPATRMAALAMAGLSGVYLVTGSVLTPELWADPLGPLLKIAPVFMLSAAAALFTVER